MILKTPIRICFKIRLKSMFSTFSANKFSSNLNNFLIKWCEFCLKSSKTPHGVNHEVL